jgi:PAS domain S-box-containing protein
MPRKKSSNLPLEEQLARLRARVAELEARQADCVRQSEALRESEAHYRALADRSQTWFQAASDGIHVLDEEGNVVEVNDAFCRMLGYTREELLRLNVADWEAQWPPGELSARFDKLSGQLEVFETQHRRKDGMVRDVEVSGTRVVLDGRTYFCASVRDVTNHKRAEAAMSALATRYQTLLQSASDGIHVLDEDGNVVEFNDAFCRMLGYTREELPHLKVAEWDLQWSPEELRVRHRELVGRHAVFETQHRRKDGEVRDVEISGTGVALDNHVYFFASARDITDRKRAAAALAALAARYQTLLRAASDGIHVLDEQGNVVEVNDAFCQMLGYTREELLQRNVANWEVMWSSEGLPARIQELIGRRAVFETRHRRKDGEVRDVEISSTGVVLDSRAYLYSSARDITDRKRMEQSERDQRELAEALRDVASTLNSTLSLTEVFDRILIQVQRIVPHDAADIMLLEEDATANTLIARIVRGRRFEQFTPGFRGEGSSFVIATTANLRWMQATGQPRIVSDTQRDAEWVHFPEIDWIRCSMGAPIQSKGQVIGFLAVNSATPDFFTTTQADRLQAFADQAAIALENARLFEETRQRVVELEVLYENALELSQLSKPKDIGRKIIALLARKLAWHHTIIRQYHPETDSLEVLAFNQPNVKDDAEARALEERFATLIARPGQGLSGWVVQHGQTVRSSDVTGDPRYLETYPGLRSGLYAPLKVGERIVGVISIESERANAFSAADERLVTTLATQAAIALENAMLYDQLNRYTAELEARVAARTAELDRERQRLQAILDSADDGIHFMNPQREIQYANPAIERITGYTFEEMKGQQPAQLWRNALTSPSVYQALDASVSRGMGWQGEIISQRKDGTPYEVSMTITPIRDANNDLLGFVTIHRDITPQKELERLRSQFVTRIGHELRTPLSAIILNLDLLEHGKPERQAHYRQKLKDDAARLQRLIEAFFQMAGLDANTTPPELAPINLNVLAREIAADQTDAASERGLIIDLQLDPATGTTPVVADGDGLRQAIRIVLDNALMYTPPPGTITLRTGVHARNDQTWYTLTIQDTGPGITREEMPHIFDRFYRGSAAGNYTVAGTGLGLSIARALMDKMNGQITADSTPGQGATFTLWLRPVI